jgi:omega-6 fatty acid desaturase (delta-12 desaturase)
LCSRVPNYRLQACLEAAPELHGIAKVITLRESLGCWRLALWDERRRLLVGFTEAPQLGVQTKDVLVGAARIQTAP